MIAKTKEEYQNAVDALTKEFEQQFDEYSIDDLDEDAVLPESNCMISGYNETVYPLT